MRIGYARVSTEDQNLDLQIAALKQAQCHHIFKDQGISGACFSRPGLNETLALLKPGHTLVVWRLDRLGRSLRHLVDLVDQLGQRGIQFVSLTESINTKSPGGTLLFHMMAALAQFERALISERTRAGMAVARKQGRRMGRPFALSQAQCDAARHALLDRKEPLADVARRYNVHPRTLRRRALGQS